MDLNKLSPTVSKSKKRVGRGYGSGRGGHTSGRGNKGQKARNTIGLFFEGTKTKKSLIRRLPLIRGKGKLKARKTDLIVVNVKYLNLFKKDDEVNVGSLKEKGVLAKDTPENSKIKILGEGELAVSLTVFLPVSKGARAKIEKAGGKIISG